MLLLHIFLFLPFTLLLFSVPAANGAVIHPLKSRVSGGSLTLDTIDAGPSLLTTAGAQKEADSITVDRPVSLLAASGKLTDSSAPSSKFQKLTTDAGATIPTTATAPVPLSFLEKDKALPPSSLHQATGIKVDGFKPNTEDLPRLTTTFEGHLAKYGLLRETPAPVVLPKVEHNLPPMASSNVSDDEPEPLSLLATDSESEFGFFSEGDSVLWEALEAGEHSCQKYQTQLAFDESGKMDALRHHVIKCGKNQLLNRWRFSRAGSANMLTVYYTCCSVGKLIATCRNMGSEWTPDPSGKLEALSKQGAMCGGNQGLREWRTAYDMATRKVRIEYQCCELPRSRAFGGCVDKVTTKTPASNSALDFTRHDASCFAGYAMTRWGFVEYDKQMWVSYTCCAVGKMAHLGKPQTCSWVGDPHIYTFDQTRIDTTAPGAGIAYWMVRSKWISVQSYYQGLGPLKPAWTRAIAVGGPFIRNHKFVIAKDVFYLESSYPAYRTSLGFRILWDGKNVSVGSSLKVLGDGLVTVQQKGVQYIVHFPLGVELRVTIHSFYIDAFLTMGHVPGGQDGQCGSNDFNSGDDQKPRLEYNGTLEVKASENLFVSAPTVVPVQAGRFYLWDCKGDKRKSAEALCNEKFKGGAHKIRDFVTMCIYDACFSEIAAAPDNDLAAEEELGKIFEIEKPRLVTLAHSARTWDEAKETCEKHGLEIFKIQSKVEMSAVWQIASQDDSLRRLVWTGGRFKDGKWVWADGTEVAKGGFTKWEKGHGESTNPAQVHLCVDRLTGLWVECNDNLRNIACAKPKGYGVQGMTGPNNARVACGSGKSLAMPKSSAENDNLKKVLSTELTSGLAFLGARYDPSLGWLWDDGSFVSYTNWGTNQPDLSKQYTHALWLCMDVATGKWEVCYETDHHLVLCETSLETLQCPVSSDAQAISNRAVQCAREGGSCHCTGQAFYGAFLTSLPSAELKRSGFKMVTASASTLCADHVLGDPHYGSAKFCYCQELGSETAKFCSHQNAHCSCGGTLYYGSKYTDILASELETAGYFSKATTAAVTCSAGTFGGDPKPNYHKTCLCQPAEAATATFCAIEGHACTCSGTVWYGAISTKVQTNDLIKSGFAAKVSEGSLACTTGTFGDPHANEHKFCYCEDSLISDPHFCAKEGGTCKCAGNVWFGGHFPAGMSSEVVASNGFAQKSVDGDFQCGVSTFGSDPMYGYHKVCFCAAPEKMPEESGPRGTQCAREGEQCECSGTVYYGAFAGSLPAVELKKSGFAMKMAPGDVYCSDGNFGDPHYGFHKYCYCQAAGDKLASYCSHQNSHCHCGGVVYYGAKLDRVRVSDLQSNGFLSREISAPRSCNAATLGSDPHYGYYKTCLCQSAGQDTGTFCALEGGTCDCVGTIWYGTLTKSVHVQDLVQSGFATRTVTGSLICQGNSFGYDPHYGYHKSCFCEVSPDAHPLFCAQEGQTCSCPGNIWYGGRFSNGIPSQELSLNGFTSKDLDGKHACNTNTFGLDPKYGHHKTCFCVVPDVKPVLAHPDHEFEIFLSNCLYLGNSGEDCDQTCERAVDGYCDVGGLEAIAQSTSACHLAVQGFGGIIVPTTKVAKVNASNTRLGCSFVQMASLTQVIVDRERWGDVALRPTCSAKSDNPNQRRVCACKSAEEYDYPLGHIMVQSDRIRVKGSGKEPTKDFSITITGKTQEGQHERHIPGQAMAEVNTDGSISAGTTTMMPSSEQGAAAAVEVASSSSSSGGSSSSSILSSSSASSDDGDDDSLEEEGSFWAPSPEDGDSAEALLDSPEMQAFWGSNVGNPSRHHRTHDHQSHQHDFSRRRRYTAKLSQVRITGQPAHHRLLWQSYQDGRWSATTQSIEDWPFQEEFVPGEKQQATRWTMDFKKAEKMFEVSVNGNRLPYLDFDISDNVAFHEVSANGVHGYNSILLPQDIADFESPVSYHTENGCSKMPFGFRSDNVVWEFRMRLDSTFGRRCLRCEEVALEYGNNVMLEHGKLVVTINNNAPNRITFSKRFKEHGLYNISIVYLKAHKTVQLYLDRTLVEQQHFIRAMGVEMKKAMIGCYFDQRIVKGAIMGMQMSPRSPTYMRKHGYCAEYKGCRHGYRLRDDAFQYLCKGPVCMHNADEDTCCAKLATCEAYRCPQGEEPIAHPEKVWCEGTSCKYTDRHRCCVSKMQCTSLTCPHHFTMRHEASETYCNGPCTLEKDLDRCCDRTTTCGTYSCPVGFTNKPGWEKVPCKSRPCSLQDRDMCCVPQGTCSAFSCPASFTHRHNAASIFCEDTVCKETPYEKCCVPDGHCDSLACPSYMVHSSLMLGHELYCQGEQCDKGDRKRCCTFKAKCNTHKCPKHLVLVADAHKKRCKSFECHPDDSDECCTKRGFCDSFACPKDYSNRANAHEILCEDAACKATDWQRCCAPNNLCGSMTCPAGWIAKADSSTTPCTAAHCETEKDTAVCCDKLATCSSHMCPFGQVLMHNSSDVFCAGHVCNRNDTKTCCVPAGNCLGANCPVGYFHRQDAHDRVCRTRECDDNDYHHCCEHANTCSTFRCPRRFVLRPDANDTECATPTCTRRDLHTCCERRQHCGGYHCPPHNNLRIDAEHILCRGELCDVDDAPTCCQRVGYCESFDCPANYRQRPNASEIPCLDVACNLTDYQTCCVPEASCETFECPKPHYTPHPGTPRTCKGWQCTEEDLEICCLESPRCSTFTCPPGKSLKQEALNDVCELHVCMEAHDVDTCCENNGFCSTFDCPAPAYLHRADKDMLLCDDADCTSKTNFNKCCAEASSCLTFQCPEYHLARVDVADLHCVGMTCTPSDAEVCCDKRESCASYSCPVGLHLSPSAHLLYCRGPECDTLDMPTCCVAKSYCDAMTCPAGFQHRFDAKTIPCDDISCEKTPYDTCCVSEALCLGYNCPSPNWNLRPDAGSVWCNGWKCSEVDKTVCCEEVALCDTLDCPSPLLLRGNAASLSCATTVCSSADVETCCIEAGTCAAHYTCPSAYLLRSNADEIKCKTDNCTYDEFEHCCILKNFCSTMTCPVDMVLRQQADLLTCNGYQCGETDVHTCCEGRGKCATVDCPHNLRQKEDDAVIFCENSTCSEGDIPTCCESQDSCMDYTCPMGYGLRDDAAHITCGIYSCRETGFAHCCSPLDSCELFSCPKYTVEKTGIKLSELYCTGSQCVSVCCDEKATCSNFPCPEHYVKKPDNYTLCSNTSCSVVDVEECCSPDDRCTSVSCPAGKAWRHNAADLTCGDHLCGDEDAAHCCVEANSCLSHTCPYGLAHHANDTSEQSLCHSSPCTEADDYQCCGIAASCSTFMCPDGFSQRSHANSIFCSGIECDFDKDLHVCCSDARTCAGFDCQSNVSGYILRYDAPEHVCSGANCSVACCVLETSCDGYACPAGYGRLATDYRSYCEGRCTDDDVDKCCAEEGRCPSFECPANFVPKPGYADLHCHDLHCDMTDIYACCNERASCSTFNCPNGSYPLNKTGLLCAGHECNEDVDAHRCCTQRAHCSTGDFLCPPGTVEAVGKDGYCSGVNCTDSDIYTCCRTRATCGELDCGSGRRHTSSANSTLCLSYHCEFVHDSDTCCEEV